MRVVLVGATGLVGRAVIARCVGLRGLRLGAIGRRRIELPLGARMEFFVAEPDNWAETLSALRPEAVICALGTTWSKAGKDEEAFRAIDEKLVLRVAVAARDAGTRQFIFVSSAGASIASKHLYLQVKEQVENALSKLRFRRLDIVRPGLLRGSRMDDPRPLERLMMLASPIIDPFLQGRYRAWRSISAERLAEAILSLTLEKADGRFMHEHDALLRAARRLKPDALATA
jgi:uncharacterized protein YbjT (DUF2867 family)